MGAHPLRLPLLALAFLGAWLCLYELNVVLALTTREGVIFGRPAHLIIAFAGVLICGLGARRQTGTARTAWLLITIGMACWNLGDTYWTAVLLDQPSIPVPSPADAGYLLFPVFALTGLTLLLRARGARSSALLWFDGAAAALAVSAVVAWIVLPTIVSGMQDAETAAIATNLAYPVTDVIMLGLVVGAVALQGWRVDRRWALVGAAVLTFWVADANYLIKLGSGTYRFPSALDVGWSLCTLLMAAASWQPVRAAGVVRVESSGRRSVLLPIAFAAVSLAVLTVAGVRSDVSDIAVLLAGASLVAVGLRLWLTFRDNVTMLADSRREALTDALTGLGNRRALSHDLELVLARREAGEEHVLTLLDLDGFKHYNDSFGHPAGDALLVRLSAKLEAVAGPDGRVYRMGGDEFCALLPHARGGDAQRHVARIAAALSEHGHGFSITASHGSVILPTEVRDPEQALRVADQRMYANKAAGRASAGRQSRDVLLRALMERSPDLGTHLESVAGLAVQVARRLGMSEEDVERVGHAAELHDIGKVAIPDAILGKPGPLTGEEWEFMHRHTIIGERIVAAAPALQEVAPLVRASHERWDGGGYPDRIAGEEIPLGARIVSVCDAFDAMVADRPYRAAMTSAEALAELRASAGTHFDPRVVEAFCSALRERTAQVRTAVAA